MSIKLTKDRLLKPAKIKISINRWYGLNYTDTVANGECCEMKNISSDGSYIFPRPSREVIAEGITNPQKLLFCGDKLSYIAEGKLNVSSGEGFDSIGDVGTVSTAVDFNNTKMLFYPTNYVYDYEKESINSITDYLDVALGSYTQDGSFSNEYNNVNLQWRSQSYDNRICATFVVIGSANNYIAASPKMEDGEIKRDSNGKIIYNEIVINVTGNSSGFLTDGVRTNTYHMKLFVQAWDDDGNLLTKRSEYTTYFAEYSFGKPILVNNVAPAKILVQVGYYETPVTSSWSSSCSDACISRRTEDLGKSDFKLWITSTEYPAPNSVPAIAYACMDNNRVVAVQGNNFYASSLGDYADWTDFVDADGNPKETGAYAEELYTFGDFTGIVKYRNNVIITKKDTVYECYGNKPPYRINLAASVGCIDNRSFCEIGGVLYWLGAEGVYRYAGGLPVNISQKINSAFGKFQSGCSASDGRRYYIYIKAELNSCLLVYDTVTGLWCKEDDIGIVDMASFDNAVYALTDSGVIYKFQSGNENVEWEFTTKSFDLNSNYKKIPKMLTLKVKAGLNANLDVYIKYDNSDFKRIAQYGSFERSVVDIRLKNKPCDSFSLKLCGRGDIRIYGIDIDVISSNKPHNKDYLVRY